MANDIDQCPVYDPIVKKDGMHLSDVWASAFSIFYQDITQFVGQFGLFLPTITTEQRDSIQSPMNGQMIYNVTILSAQYFNAGVWTSF